MAILAQALTLKHECVCVCVFFPPALPSVGGVVEGCAEAGARLLLTRHLRASNLFRRS